MFKKEAESAIERESDLKKRIDFWGVNIDPRGSTTVVADYKDGMGEVTIAFFPHVFRDGYSEGDEQEVIDRYGKDTIDEINRRVIVKKAIKAPAPKDPIK